MMPTQCFPCRLNLSFPKGGAVTGLGSLLIGRALANNRFAANQGRPAGIGFGTVNGLIDGCGVVPVDIGNDLPAIAFEAFGRVVGKPASYLTVNRDAVIIVKGDSIYPALGFPPANRPHGKCPP